MLTNSLDAAVAQRLKAPPTQTSDTSGQTHSTVNQANGASPKTSTDPVISIRSLRKRYGNQEAVRGIDLEVGRGEIFAFLGPNGAGKTTTVEILEGFREASSGTVEVLGVDPAHAPSSWRERIGVVLQESAPEPGLTVRECLEMHAGYYRAPRQVQETLALVDLGGKAQERAASLSGGQRRRLDVALALIGDPELIFLDEPTTGFDPSARQTAWTVIAGLRALGKTVFLTTHHMEEAERLADRIAIIAAGKIVAQGTPRTLGDRHLTGAQISFTLPDGMAVHDLPLAPGARVQEQEGRRIVFSSHSVVSDLHCISGWALDQGFELEDLQVNRPTLEDIYLNLTQQPRSSR